jgi:hypothetical protein
VNDRLHDQAVAGARLLVAYTGEGDDLAHVTRAALRLEPGLAERLMGETVDKALDEVEQDPDGIAVLLVAEDGSSRLAAGRL